MCVPIYHFLKQALVPSSPETSVDNEGISMPYVLGKVGASQTMDSR